MGVLRASTHAQTCENVRPPLCDLNPTRSSERALGTKVVASSPYFLHVSPERPNAGLAVLDSHETGLTDALQVHQNASLTLLSRSREEAKCVKTDTKSTRARRGAKRRAPT